jgi:hypothetical protein
MSNEEGKQNNSLGKCKQRELNLLPEEIQLNILAGQ